MSELQLGKSNMIVGTIFFRFDHIHSIEISPYKERNRVAICYSNSNHLGGRSDYKYVDDEVIKFITTKPTIFDIFRILTSYYYLPDRAN